MMVISAIPMLRQILLKYIAAQRAFVKKQWEGQNGEVAGDRIGNATEK